MLVVNKDNVVEQRRVTLGQLLVGGLRVIATGLTADDRVVLTTNGRAVPGRKGRAQGNYHRHAAGDGNARSRNTGRHAASRCATGSDATRDAPAAPPAAPTK